MANKEKRRDYVQAHESLVDQGAVIIYQDETNVNLFCGRKFGRAKIGERSTVTRPPSKGKNIHIVGAMSSDGVFFLDNQEGSNNKETFKEHMKNIISAAAARYTPGSKLVIVIDNAPCHRGIEQVNFDEVRGDHEVQILRLAPYSFLLNPIEKVWSKLKGEIRAELAARTNEIVNASGNVTQARRSGLKQCIDSGCAVVSQITPSEAFRYISRAQRYFPACLALEDLVEISNYSGNASRKGSKLGPPTPKHLHQLLRI